ncbi:hypothetical protein TNCV_1806491 [Trichonephila clavipes]|nr:hypothetical protein TNCV_1806491 [Trichonephila clavipes]
MSRQRNLSKSRAWRIIGKLKSRQTQKTVADTVGIGRSIIAGLWNRFQEVWYVRRWPGQDPPSVTTTKYDFRRILVRREGGTQNNPIYVQKRSHYRRSGLMVWDGISVGGRTNLYYHSG